MLKELNEEGKRGKKGWEGPATVEPFATQRRCARYPEQLKP